MFTLHPGLSRQFLHTAFGWQVGKMREEQSSSLLLSSANCLLTEGASSGAPVDTAAHQFIQTVRIHRTRLLRTGLVRDLSPCSWFIERIGWEHTCTDTPPLCCSSSLPHHLLTPPMVHPRGPAPHSFRGGFRSSLLKTGAARRREEGGGGRRSSRGVATLVPAGCRYVHR